MVNDLPFSENGNLRTFEESVVETDLKWHWDEEDRLITPTHDTDWLFQYDNKLAQPMLKDVTFFIAAGMFHRLIKGSGSLTLNVLKCQTCSKS